MKHLILLVALVGILISCASTEEKKSGDIFSQIENADFMPKKTVEYVPNKDVFTGDVSDNDSISTESVNRLPAPKLEKLEETDDPISTGISLCYRGKFDHAFKVFDEAYEKYKNHPGYWNQIGTCYLIQNDFRKSLLYYNKALGIDDKYTPAINNFGVLYLRQGKEQLAMEAFKKASEVNSFSLTPMFNLAHLYLKYGAMDKAYRILIVLHNKNKNDVDVLSALASYNLMVGNPKNAVAFYNNIDNDHMKRPDIAINYAYALKQVGKDSEAKEILQGIPSKNLQGYETYYGRIKNYVGN